MNMETSHDTEGVKERKKERIRLHRAVYISVVDVYSVKEAIMG
ncbi:hypothetical protein E2C01_061365 [Portunus trituberculatus]|uniref:Uncharacterized protein n=1 Tax=Portunus trituberculatus TaxID=210409 RepID=A0A5B7HE70_PORTR|nr:hypothetical protein [Portunus trituberculatus]